MMAVMLVGRFVYLAASEHTIKDTLSAVTSHPAVSSIGIDFLLSVVSLLTWTYTGVPSNEGESNIGRALVESCSSRSERRLVECDLESGVKRHELEKVLLPLLILGTWQ